MTDASPLARVAVIGAGMAGATCAAGLQRAGCEVTVFEKSRGVGGRLATRRTRVALAGGDTVELAFDHGAQMLTAREPRFAALLGRAEAAGVLRRWQPRIHADWPAAFDAPTWVAVPGMPALCGQMLAGLAVRTGQTVQRLQRARGGWQLVTEDGPQGPFDQVVLALPPQQAAVLLAGLHDVWADALASRAMDACWTLMAVTEDVDWPWDAAEPARGPLAWVSRSDRRPGRPAAAGHAVWVAQADADWSAAHLEDDPATVAEALGAALQAVLPRPTGRPLAWFHRSVHRWRYARPSTPEDDRRLSCWDPARGLGVCGDHLGGGDVEGAWRSGDDLAERIAVELETRQARTTDAVAA
jgi:predicted NAD/FAD-dependent oxidoreductase